MLVIDNGIVDGPLHGTTIHGIVGTYQDKTVVIMGHKTLIGEARTKLDVLRMINSYHRDADLDFV